MSLSTLAAAAVTKVASIAPTVVDGYEVSDFSADLVAGAGTILPWVGAAVAAGVALMFIFMGIRKGLAFFKSTAR